VVGQLCDQRRGEWSSRSWTWREQTRCSRRLRFESHVIFKSLNYNEKGLDHAGPKKRDSEKKKKKAGTAPFNKMFPLTFSSMLSSIYSSIFPFNMQYRLRKRLHGHKDAILSLGVSIDGSFLASGGLCFAPSNFVGLVWLRTSIGLDGVRLWGLSKHKKYQEAQTPEHGRTLRGPPSCLTWARRQEDNRNVLAFGTAFGYLVFWWYNEDKVSVIAV
jgi:hypothetical protein